MLRQPRLFQGAQSASSLAPRAMAVGAPLLLSFLVGGCRPALPDHYGVFCVSGKTLSELQPTRHSVRGTLLQRKEGLVGPTGPELGNVDSILVFEKGAQPSELHLARLTFTDKAQLRGLLSLELTDVGLWTEAELVPCQVAPVAGRSDMYRLTPKEALGNGFYEIRSDAAVSFLSGSQVFDFVVGRKSDYRSRDELRIQHAAAIRTRTEQLISGLNDALNSRSWGQVEDYFHPGGRPMTGDALGEYRRGVEVWFGQSGKILGSKVLAISTVDDAGKAQVLVETTYARAGIQKETLEIAEIGGRYFIVSMR